MSYYHNYESTQRWMPSLQYPYPMKMKILQTPLSSSSSCIYSGTHSGSPKDSSHHIIVYDNNNIAYPTTHSIPGPYLQSYITLPNKKI